MHTAESGLLLSSEELKDKVYIASFTLRRYTFLLGNKSSPKVERKLSKGGKFSWNACRCTCPLVVPKQGSLLAEGRLVQTYIPCQYDRMISYVFPTFSHPFIPTIYRGEDWMIDKRIN